MTAAAPATILYLHSSDDLYGADRILLEIVTNLDRARFRPLVVLPEDMKHVGLLSAELTNAGVEFVHLPIAIVRRRYFKAMGMLAFARNLVAGTIAIRRLARAHGVQLIHGFTLAVAAAPAAAWWLRLPLVMHVHEIVERPPAVRRLLHRLGVRWADRVVCVSDAVRRNVLKDEPQAALQLQVIRNGIRAPKPSIRSPEELRRELGVPADGALVGMIGRISPWKGQAVFLQAAARLRDAGWPGHFIAIGGVFDHETAHLDRLTQLHAALHLGGTVTLREFLPAAREFLPAFDVLVLPSTSPDPLPTVVLEAMAAAVPVIATAHGGAVEMVIDGATGLLVPPGDADALAGAVMKLLPAPGAEPTLAREMGKAGRARMLALFETERFMADIQLLYAELLKPSSTTI